MATKYRRSGRGRKITEERKARAERPKKPIVHSEPVTTLDDSDIVKHDHNDDRWYSDCPACNS